MALKNEIQINGETYLKKSAITDGAKRIVIFQRGWIAVGDYSRDGESCLLGNAAIIRRWGTTKGLGEIASGGPTEKTVMDKCPDIRFNILTTVMMIDCDEGCWK